MKKTVCMVLMMAMLLSMTAFAADLSSGDQAAEAVYQYVDAMDKQDWETYISLLPADQQEDMQAFVDNYSDTNLGVFNILSAEIVSIDEVDVNHSRYVYDYKEKYGNDLKSYLVGINFDVKEDCIYSYDGLSMFFVSVGKEDGEWKVLEIPRADVDTMETVFPKATDETLHAIQLQKLRNQGVWLNNSNDVLDIDADAKVSTAAVMSLNPESDLTAYTANEDQFTRPTIITVWMARSQQIREVEFYDYCKSVLYTEWGAADLTTGEPHPMAALEAGAQCVKMRAWYNSKHTSTWSHGCMVNNTVDGNYQPGYQHERATQAINNVGGIGIKNFAGNVMNTYFMASPSGSNGYHGGICGQKGSIWLAKNWGYTWQDIIHYYFDNASNVSPGGACSWFYY